MGDVQVITGDCRDVLKVGLGDECPQSVDRRIADRGLMLDSHTRYTA